MADVLMVNQPAFSKNIAAPREIDCANPQKDFFIQPIGLSYITGLARQHADAKIIDANVLRENYSWIAGNIKKENPKIVLGGFSPPTVDMDLHLGKITKENSHALFGIWGPVPSSIKKELFEKYPELDFVVENEPEFVVAELAEKLGKQNIFLGTRGLSYRKGSRVISNPLRKLEDINKLAFPAYDLLPIKKYYTPYSRRLPMAFIRTSRGCPFSCIFCMIGGQTNPLIGYGKRWRAYSVGRALEEIKWLANELGIREINFFDPEFTIDKKRVIEICKGIVKEKLDIIWNCQARVDQVNIEVLKWMKKAGCYGISYGLETTDKNIMNAIGKKVSKELAESAIMATRKAEILCGVFFMLGLPGETIETAKKNIKFAKHISRRYGARPQCTIATPYPGTIFWELAKKNNWITGGLTRLEQTTPIVNYPQLSSGEIDALHDEFYREVVLDPVRLISRLFRMRHANELKNALLAIKHFAGNYFGRMRYVR